jgi:predicted DNA-binding transcriptional regulator AlpA
MSAQSNAPKLLNTPELADMLTNKSNTIEGWRIKGIGPKYIKIGRLVRYRPEDVEEWLEAQSRNSTSQAVV